MSDIKDSGKAVIENGDIVIRVRISALKTIAEGIPSGWGDPLYDVTDVEVFAEDLVRELNREEEDGTTLVHRMFDGAIAEAVEQGAEGIEVAE